MVRTGLMRGFTGTVKCRCYGLPSTKGVWEHSCELIQSKNLKSVIVSIFYRKNNIKIKRKVHK